MVICFLVCVFFFQAEDGIRDDLVTGVQTCALPISSVVCLAAISRYFLIGAAAGCSSEIPFFPSKMFEKLTSLFVNASGSKRASKSPQIGRASCRERV